MPARAFATEKNCPLAIGLAVALVGAVGLERVATAAASPSDSPAATNTEGWRTVVSKFAQEHFNNPAWGYSHSRA